MNDHRQVSWVCPLCRTVTTADDCGDDNCENRDQICSICLLRPDWEALPQAVRNEVGAMVDEERVIPAGYLLADLDGHQRAPMEYMKLAFCRSKLRKRACSCPDAVHGAVDWGCPSCNRPLLGCEHLSGETCAPCDSAPAWNALSQAVRDEVGTMIRAGQLTSAAYRLRDLDDNRRDTFDYVLMTVHAQGR